jgi:hypothetical protein
MDSVFDSDNKSNHNGRDKVDIEDTVCELCSRTELTLTRHHLIPQSRHNKARTQRNFSRDAMKTDIAMLCRPCHSQIHRIFDNHELASYYHTIERLQTHSEVQKFINWVKKRPAGLKIRVRR